MSTVTLEGTSLTVNGLEINAPNGSRLRIEITVIDSAPAGKTASAALRIEETRSAFVKPPGARPRAGHDPVDLRVMEVLQEKPMTGEQVCDRLGLHFKDPERRRVLTRIRMTLATAGFVTVVREDKDKRFKRFQIGKWPT